MRRKTQIVTLGRSHLRHVLGCHAKDVLSARVAFGVLYSKRDFIHPRRLGQLIDHRLFGERRVRVPD